MSRRKRVLTLETKLRSAETVILERDKKLESVMKELNQFKLDKEESEQLIQTHNEQFIQQQQ